MSQIISIPNDTELCTNVSEIEYGPFIDLKTFILGGYAFAKVNYKNHVIPMTMTRHPEDPSIIAYTVEPMTVIKPVTEALCYKVLLYDKEHILDDLHILVGQSKENCNLPQKRTGKFLLQLTDDIARLTKATKNKIEDVSTIPVQGYTKFPFAPYQIITSDNALSWYEDHGYRPYNIDDKDDPDYSEESFQKTVDLRKQIRDMTVSDMITMHYDKEIEKGKRYAQMLPSYMESASEEKKKRYIEKELETCIKKIMFKNKKLTEVLDSELSQTVREAMNKDKSLQKLYHIQSIYKDLIGLQKYLVKSYTFE